MLPNQVNLLLGYSTAAVAVHQSVRELTSGDKAHAALWNQSVSFEPLVVSGRSRLVPDPFSLH